MDLDELRRQIRSLVTLEDAPEPVLSRFCDLRGCPEAARERSSSRLAAGRADVVVTLRDRGTPSAKEELVRLAVAGGAHVEVVEESEALARLGGVGALLRYAGPDVALAEAATAGAAAART